MEHFVHSWSWEKSKFSISCIDHWPESCSVTIIVFSYSLFQIEWNQWQILSQATFAWLLGPHHHLWQEDTSQPSFSPVIFRPSISSRGHVGDCVTVSGIGFPATAAANWVYNWHEREITAAIWYWPNSARIRYHSNGRWGELDQISTHYFHTDWHCK